MHYCLMVMLNEMLDRILLSIVQVLSPNDATGAGFCVGTGQLIFTNRHVVGTSSWVGLTWKDGSSQPGRVVLADRKLDLAAVAFDGITRPAVVLADSDP